MVYTLWSLANFEIASVGEPSTQMTLNTFHFAGMCGLCRLPCQGRLILLAQVTVPPTSPSVSLVFVKSS